MEHGQVYVIGKTSMNGSFPWLCEVTRLSIPVLYMFLYMYMYMYMYVYIIHDMYMYMFLQEKTLARSERGQFNIRTPNDL